MRLTDPRGRDCGGVAGSSSGGNESAAINTDGAEREGKFERNGSSGAGGKEWVPKQKRGGIKRE